MPFLDLFLKDAFRSGLPRAFGIRLFSVFLMWSSAVCAEAVVISVDSGNNPNGDGTALYQLVEFPDPITSVLFGSLSSSSSTSGLISLSELRTVEISGTRYIQLAFDVNEPGNNSGDDWQIDTFALSIGATTVYELDAADVVAFNPTGVIDANNGGGDVDGAILIPEALFQGQGFSLSDQFSVTASFSGVSAGADRLIVGPGDGTPLVVPEPSVPFYCLIAALAWIGSTRRRN